MKIYTRRLYHIIKSNLTHVNHEFDIFISPDSTILILGSFPSVISRKENFYYMNPNNRFYKLLTKIYNEPFDDKDINIKKQLLKKYHIALYDVIDNCDIYKSSDSHIYNEKVTDIAGICRNYPIKKIYLNGKKAYELFIKNFPSLINIATYLPSTSSANASFSLDKLYEKWKIINS